MALNTILYPLDPTGRAPSNRISDEEHVIGVNRYRAFALRGGPFFVNDLLVVKDLETNNQLVMGRDYTPLYNIPSAIKVAQGKKICGVILIHNPKVSTRISVSYQVLGAQFTSMNDVIAKALEDLELDNRNTYWRHILEKPSLFQAAPHDHDVGDIFGFEYHIAVLNDLVEAVRTGSSKVVDELLEKLKSDIATVTRLVNDHKSDTSNPHRVTPGQINVYDKTEINKKLADIQRQFEGLEPRFKDALDKIKANLERINTNTNNLIAHGRRVTNIETRFNSYNTVIAELNTSIDEINQNIRTLKSRVDAVESTVNTHSGQISALAQKDAELKRLIDALTGRVTAAESLNTSQSTLITQLQERDRQLQSAINTLTNTNNTQNSQIQSIIGVNNTQNSQIQTLQNKVRSLEGKDTDIQVVTGSGSLQLTGGKRYVIFAYGRTGDRGNSTMGSVVFRDSSNNTIGSTGSFWVNWPDGNVPQTGFAHITAPANGQVRGFMDWGGHNGGSSAAVSMLAFRVN